MNQRLDTNPEPRRTPAVSTSTTTDYWTARANLAAARAAMGGLTLACRAAASPAVLAAVAAAEAAVVAAQVAK
jgi:hypothetical protein